MQRSYKHLRIISWFPWRFVSLVATTRKGVALAQLRRFVDSSLRERRSRAIKRFAHFQFSTQLANNIAPRFSASHLPSVSTIRLSFSTFLFANLATLSPSPFTGEKTHLKTEIASKSGNENERVEERLLFNDGRRERKGFEKLWKLCPPFSFFF